VHFSARRCVGHRHVRGVLVTCQSGFEALLARELTELHAATTRENGPGWVDVSPPGGEPATPAPANRPEAIQDLAFAHLTLENPADLRGDSVNQLAGRIVDYFAEALRGERIEVPWPNVWLGPHELVGLGRRISAVETAFCELLKRKLARVAKLRSPDIPRGVGVHPGLFVFFRDFGRVAVARTAYVHGARRMADDPLAPSRSYLKVEEAYVVLGREPANLETVCDLGAAPGGWSFSAAKHGARVVAIDNGPLKGGALDHPLITHRREDAFRFSPGTDGSFDWLFCDMVEDPHRIVREILEPWLMRGWCRRFVVNLKFGRVDPVALLRELKFACPALHSRAPGTLIRHLYHDREEFTLVGEVRH